MLVEFISLIIFVKVFSYFKQYAPLQKCFNIANSLFYCLKSFAFILLYCFVICLFLTLFSIIFPFSNIFFVDLNYSKRIFCTIFFYQKDTSRYSGSIFHQSIHNNLDYYFNYILNYLRIDIKH